MGLTNELFQAWFGAPGIDFGWQIRDSSADGVIIGFVGSDIGQYHTQFVFKAGVLHCCWEDDPFILNDINDAGYIVGDYGGNSDSPPVFCPPGILSCEPMAGDRSITMAPGLSPPKLLYIIDDRNRIASDLGTLVPIPEPSTFVTLGAAFLILGAILLRR